MSSLTYKILRKLHIVSKDSRNKDISVFGAIGKLFKYLKTIFIVKYCYSSMLLEPLNFMRLRAKLWRKAGCNVGEDVRIGCRVAFDYIHADQIHLEDHIAISNDCILLCHKRDLSGYRKGDDSWDLPYVYKPIYLKRGCRIGMGSMIMPGVTVGEGAVVGARSVVTKDVPPWTVVAGSPAKVIREISERDE